MSIVRFSWQLEYGYGPLQIYFKKDCWTMAIQECYYFNGVGVHFFLFSFFRCFFRCHILFLSLVLTIYFCYSQLIFFLSYFKKSRKISKKKRSNILKKMNSLKKGQGVPHLNFKKGPGVPLLKFDGVPGATFKLWGGPRSRVLVPLLHHASWK